MSERVQELLAFLDDESRGARTKYQAALHQRIPPRGAKGLGSVQREIASEIAHSLGRAGNRIEQCLQTLTELGQRLDALPASDVEHGVLVTRFNRVRDQALARLRDLKIQREALGLRRHDELDVRYPIPRTR